MDGTPGTGPSLGGVRLRDPRSDSAIQAFCRSFLHAIKTRNMLLAVLSCRAFLLQMNRGRPT